MRSIFIIAILSGLAIQGYAQISENKKTNDESRYPTADQLGVVNLEKEYIENLEELFFPKQQPDESGNWKSHTKEVLIRVLLAQMPKASKPIRTNPHILKDTKVLPEDPETHSSMLQELFPSSTFSGEVFRQLVLKNWPTFDQDEIEHRQEIIEKNIIIPDQALTNIDNKLKELKRFETRTTTLFDTADFVYSNEVQELILRNSGYQRGGIIDLTCYTATTIANYALQVLYASSLFALIAPQFMNTNMGVCNRLISVSIIAANLASSYIYRNTSGYIEKLEKQSSLHIYRKIRFRTDTFSGFLKKVLQLNNMAEIPEELRLSLTDEERVSIESFVLDSDALIASDPQTKKYHLTESITLLSTVIDLKGIIGFICSHRKTHKI